MRWPSDTGCNFSPVPPLLRPDGTRRWQNEVTFEVSHPRNEGATRDTYAAILITIKMSRHTIPAIASDPSIGHNSFTGLNTMKSTFAKAITALAVSMSTVGANAAVLNFDNLPGFNFFTSNYNGFSFGDNSIQTNPWFWTNTTTVNYIPSSGTGMVATDFSLYTGAPFEATQPIYNPIPFQFQGAFFSGSTDQIRYRLYTGTQTSPGSLAGLTLVFTSPDSAALSAAPTFVASTYVGFVTAVVIVGRQGFYAMDDFTFTPIPEPSTYGMLLAGLVAVGAVVRRRRG